MLAMLNPCLCSGAVYIRRQWAGEEAYAAKSVLLHSSIKRDSNQSINMQKLWRSDSEATPRPWPDNDFSEQKQNSSVQTELHWSLLDMRQGNGKKSWMFIFIRLGLGLNWKLAFLFWVCTKQNKSRMNGLAHTWWCMMQPVRWVWKWLTEWEWNYICSMQTLFFFPLKYCWGFISSSFSGCVSWLTAAVIYFTACMLSSFLTLKSEEALF